MSDALCVGVCMIDWDSGICLGCGRTPEEIDGVPVATPQPEQKPAQPPLPPNVAEHVGEGTE
ncbi:MAG TPA: DUF1289 domain-containing protein [Azoarcus taiwanensis]|uniref:DUF1289 domain-containing protein n=1 Tax=Azoarcus taiwanensis TaxID=666964 RepID=A0A972FC89_9RHOO|nr:DUF1289 domain-containing protein [Azoarcus taiwanensis]NMG01980.1 DUF1289 domain-containing protein [Azoarcus taiwanensis]HRQ57481.1 DUF1289 domain-containing protein [Azoarcus taiwanensis]